MADDACARFGANAAGRVPAPIPEGLSTAQLQALQQTSPPPEPGISKTQQMLAQLLHLKPDWAVSYGDRLVQQALTLWPEEAKSPRRNSGTRRLALPGLQSQI